MKPLRKRLLKFLLVSGVSSGLYSALMGMFGAMSAPNRPHLWMNGDVWIYNHMMTALFYALGALAIALMMELVRDFKGTLKAIGDSL